MNNYRARYLIVVALITAMVIMAGCGKSTPAQSQSAQEWLKKGRELSKQQKYEEAIEAYNKAIELDQKNAEIWNEKAGVLLSQNKLDESLDAFDKAITIAPKYIEHKAIVLYTFGRFNEAIKAFDKAIAINQNVVICWYYQARAYSHIKDKQNALSDLTKAISLDKNALLKDSAKKDDAFQWLQDDEDFKKLTK